MSTLRRACSPLLLVAVLGVIATPALARAKTAVQPVNLAGVETVVIPIKGMVCHDCSTSVNRALSSVPGVVADQVSLAHGQATVRFDARKVDSKKLVATIDQLGYQAGQPHAGK